MVGLARLASILLFFFGFPAFAGPLSVVSLNLMKVTDAALIEREIRERPQLRDSDIYLLQEVAHARPDAPSAAHELAARMKMQVAYAAAKPGVLDQGLAVLSRFPLSGQVVRKLKAYDLKFHSRERQALSVTVETADGPVRITNAHLDTRLNAEDRLQQLSPVVSDGVSFRMPRIVGGDFNTNDFYWLANLIPVPWIKSQVREIDRFMSSHGYRTPAPASWPTFDHLGMHLDWVYGHGIQPLAAKIFPLKFTDHHALWTQFDR
jgi:endonuclease/exonuclease/phosphatase family metal-dependent hydrolase